MDKKLLDSGLEGTIFGIESLHPYASTAVGKGWSGKHAESYVPHLVHNIWDDRVNVMLGLIVGLPKEKQDSLYKTLMWLNKNDLHAAWSVLQIQTPSSLSSKSLDSVSFLSEFDRNYQEYGYTFDNRGVWYLDDWNFLDALKFRDELMPQRKVGRLSPWLAQGLKVLGYPMKTLINPPMRGKYFMLLPEVVRRKNKFVEDYKNLLLTLKR
jgi:hypothetical protein